MTRFSPPRGPDPAERQSEALGRWLDRAGSAAPDEIDRDVVEAIYALRPDLAPAPRVTADDILASLTAGPLADPAAAAHAPAGHHEAEVVPFPRSGRSAPAPEATDSGEAEAGARAGRVWRWFGGTGGVGMALVAAATLVLVVTPVLRSRQDVSSTASPGAPAMDQAAPREVADAGAGDGEIPALHQELDRVAASPAATALAPAGAAAPAEPSVIPMADAPALGPSTLIPELSEPRQTGELAAAEASPEALDAVAAADELDELDEFDVPRADAPTAAAAAQRGAAAGAEPTPADTWRSGASGRAVSRADQALVRAEGLRAAGDRPGAARALEEAAANAPARVAQHLLGLAAEDWLAAGDRAAARAAAERGLARSADDTPERRRLQAVLAGL